MKRARTKPSVTAQEDDMRRIKLQSDIPKTFCIEESHAFKVSDVYRRGLTAVKTLLPFDTSLLFKDLIYRQQLKLVFLGAMVFNPSEDFNILLTYSFPTFKSISCLQLPYSYNYMRILGKNSLLIVRIRGKKELARIYYPHSRKLEPLLLESKKPCKEIGNVEVNMQDQTIMWHGWDNYIRVFDFIKKEELFYIPTPKNQGIQMMSFDPYTRWIFTNVKFSDPHVIIFSYDERKPLAVIRTAISAWNSIYFEEEQTLFSFERFRCSLLLLSKDFDFGKSLNRKFVYDKEMKKFYRVRCMRIDSERILIYLDAEEREGLTVLLYEKKENKFELLKNASLGVDYIARAFPINSYASITIGRKYPRTSTRLQVISHPKL